MMRKIVGDQRARQGPIGRPVFLVLLGSFLLIGIYLVTRPAAARVLKS